MDARAITRRDVLTRMGTGLVVITVSGPRGPIKPADARASGMKLRNLSAAEGRTLEALSDVLVPGAAAAGVVHFIDHQLGRENPMLLLKYMDWPGSYVDFYKHGVQSLDRQSLAHYRRPFHEATADQQDALVREISQRNPEKWEGPPAPLVYFVVRNDAADVYYGTPEGFERLQIPYMAHSLPPKRW
jgi:Gluconate 2-dehydrogenase subunit 3